MAVTVSSAFSGCEPVRPVEPVSATEVTIGRSLSTVTDTRLLKDSLPAASVTSARKR